MSDKKLDSLTPREVVAELDKYIVGQKGKTAVAVVCETGFAVYSCRRRSGKT